MQHYPATSQDCHRLKTFHREFFDRAQRSEKLDKMTFTPEDDFQKDREPRQIYEGKLLVEAKVI